MLPPLLLGIEEGGGCVTLEIDGNNCGFNMKATELRLGLPGSLSPERERDELDEKQLFPLLPSDQGICNKGVFSGSKRGYSDVMRGNWMFSVTNSKTEVQPLLVPKLDAKSSLNVSQKITMDAASKDKTVGEKGNVAHQITVSRKDSDNNSPATKALVVGWPPIRSFRKSSLSTNSKNNDEVDGKPGHDALLVKVSMDGAPYLRKVDLRNYCSYQELSSALEKLFSCFSLSQYGCHGGLEKGSLSVSKLKDLKHGSEYVLTYEDKDSDWMLVGDVPWEMFIDACRKMKIMKSSDAIGLAAPRAEEH